MRKHKFLQRVTTTVLALIFCVSVCVVPVSADSNSNRRAMIQYFENQGATALSGNIGEDDLRLFGLFMSNFYTPYETVIDTSGNAEESSFPAIVKDVCAFLLGYKDTASMSAENESIAAQFAASMIETVQKTKKPLFMRIDGKKQGDGGVTWSTWLKNKKTAELVDADDNVWFSYRTDGHNCYCDMATLVTLSAGDEYTKAYLSADDRETSTKALYVDAFGDILDAQGTVIIPACVNPYTYEIDGTVLPINNSFFMGSLLSSLYILDRDASVSYESLNYDHMTLLWNLTSNSKNNTLSPYVCGLLTTYGKPESDGSYVQKVGTLSDSLCTTFVITALSETNSNFGNFFTSFWGILNGAYDAKIRTLAHGMYIYDLNDVLQDVYVLNKTTAGTFDFSNAVKRTLFESTSFEDAMASANNAPTLDKASVLWNPAYKDYLPVDGKTVTSNNAEDVHNYVYYYDYAIEDIGRQLTQGSTTSGKLQKADRLNLWAEIFYAYMMAYDSLNPNLPDVVILNELTSALASIKGETLDGDALSQQNAELANKALKDVLKLMSDERNEEKGKLIIHFADSFLLGVHRSLLGLNDTNISAVSNANNRMFGFVSPVSLPALTELPLTSSVLEHYRTVYVVLLIIALLAAFVLLLIGLRNLKEVILTILLTAFCLLIPQTLLDSVIQLTNTAVDKLYSGRFTYWALIQHQQDLREEAAVEAEGEEYDTSLTKALSDVSAYYSASDGIQLRWMAAKKGNNFTEVTGNEPEDATIPGINTFKWLFSGYLKQESYAGDPMATYVYRTYASLAEAAKTSYDNISGISGVKVGTLTTGVEYNPTYGSGEYNATTGDFYKTVPLASDDVTSAINNANVTTLSGGLSLGTAPNAYTEAWVYLSESPYYYFYNVLKNECGEGETFLDNFLSDDVYKSMRDDQTRGAIKDFLDLEGLCTNVIPYMAASNNVVNTWVDRYGITPDNYRGSNVSDTQINNMWNMYCPWVDSLYDLSCATDNVTVWGETSAVADAFNPSYYYDSKTEQGRPMVFSEAQRLAEGVSTDDLTEVERKLIQVSDATYEDLRYLANYAQFDPEAIVTAAAMIATFNFNRVFSETSVTGEGVILYPQGFELKTFNLDAYLRLILLNNTGTSVFSTTDIYETVIDEGGSLAGVFLVAYDIIAMWLLPAAKLLIVLITFLASLLFALYLVLQKPQKIAQLAWKDLILPPLMFGVLTVGYAGVVALLMGDGITTYVGSKSGTIVTNSVGITLILLIILALVLVYGYWRIIKIQVKDALAYGSIVKDSVKAVVSEIGAGVTPFVHNKHGQITNVLNTSKKTQQDIDDLRTKDAERSDHKLHKGKQNKNALSADNGDSVQITDISAEERASRSVSQKEVEGLADLCNERQAPAQTQTGATTTEQKTTNNVEQPLVAPVVPNGNRDEAEEPVSETKNEKEKQSAKTKQSVLTETLVTGNGVVETATTTSATTQKFKLRRKFNSVPDEYANIPAQNAVVNDEAEFVADESVQQAAFADNNTKHTSGGDTH